MAACDALDGLKDGVVGNPAACRFDPAALACRERRRVVFDGGADGDAEAIYAAKQDAAGKEVFPGYKPGAESAPGSGTGGWWGRSQGDPTAMMYFGLGYFKDFVYGRGVELGTFEFDRDSKLALAKTGEALNATDTNLKPFAARGGKLVMYHGWNDPAIPALSTVEYYDGVVGTMGKKSVDAAVRLYMVPGMLHCVAGRGWRISGRMRRRCAEMRRRMCSRRWSSGWRRGRPGEADRF